MVDNLEYHCFLFHSALAQDFYFPLLKLSGNRKRMAKKIEVSYIPLEKTEDISDNPVPPWCR